MEDINTKIEDSGATADGRLSADEYNDRNEELETAVTRSGQSLTVSETTQLAESLFLNSIKAHSFQDNGVVNAVDLRPVSGASGVKVPTTYANMDGALVSFKPAVNNTGAVTVDIGQTSGIGTQPLVLSTDFSALVGSELDTTLTAQIQYDLGNNRWLLLPWSLAAASISLPLSVAQGGTGATNIIDARDNLLVPLRTNEVLVVAPMTQTNTEISSSAITVEAPIADNTEATAGIVNDKYMTPLRVAEAITAQGGVGGVVGVTVYDTGGADTYDPSVNGASKILMIATGGGGGSGGATSAFVAGQTASTGGGGAGATALMFYSFTGGVTSLNIFVGLGGTAGGITPATDGGSGTATSVTEVGGGAATIIVAGGGAGSDKDDLGITAAPVILNAQPGATGGTVTTFIGDGLEIKGGSGQDSLAGGGTGSAPGGGYGGEGGSSFWGGGARGVTLAEGVVTPALLANTAEVYGTGGPGSAQGSDGASATFQRTGHTGKNGVILIIEYA